MSKHLESCFMPISNPTSTNTSTIIAQRPEPRKTSGVNRFNLDCDVNNHDGHGFFAMVMIFPIIGARHFKLV